MTKKLILLIVAFSLIMSCIISFAVNNNISIAHTGFGVNTKIQNVQELDEFTDALAKGLNYNNRDLSSLGLDHYKYKNATMHINTVEKYEFIGYNVITTNGEHALSYTTERELTCYIVDGGIYYEAHGVQYVRSTRNNSAGEETNFYTFAKYNFDVYITEEKSYMKFKEYNEANGTNSITLREEFANMWIEVPSDVAISFAGLKDVCAEAVSSFNSSLDYLYKTYKVTPNDKSFFKEDGIEGAKISVDLIDSYRPHIKIAETMDISDDYVDSRGDIVQGAMVDAQGESVTDIVLYNINNTKIDKMGPLFTAFEVKSADELSILFSVKEYKED